MAALRGGEERVMAMRFHWMLPKGGEVVPGAAQTPVEANRYRIESVNADSTAPYPDLDGWSHWARAAEKAGIDSTLISFSRYEPDPFLVACALGQVTSTLKFIIAYRSGLMQPATFVHQLNTLSALISGRVSVNLVAGSSSSEQRGYGDFLSHDERYARTEEFLSVCHAFWRNGHDVDFDGRYYRVEHGKLHTKFLGSSGSSEEKHHSRGAPRNPRSSEVPRKHAHPEIYVSGHSEQALHLAANYASCWLRTADVPEKIAPSVKQMRDAGLSVCLRLCIICRPTYEEAVKVGESLLPQGDGGGMARTVGLKDDSVMYRERAPDAWLSRTLWNGLVPAYGPVWTTLLGTPRDLADAFLAWGEAGVDEFILSGWPELDTVETFGREVLPLIRQQEGEAAP
jgi:alkanesulfonate monooxygenase